MMAKKRTCKGLMLIGSLRKSQQVTVYLKQGKPITRPSISAKSGCNTLPQFIQRQKQRHSVALWKQLRKCDMMFTQHPTPYCNFMSLANRLPVVYATNIMRHASFVMPGVPVSDGTLPTVNQRLGEVDGVPALLTDFHEKQWVKDEKFLLYTAVQTTKGSILAEFSMSEILSHKAMTVVNGCYALVNKEFADEMKGFALVHVIGKRCSPQSLITRCTFYQQYTTEDALKKAAKSYGGLTEPKK